MTLRCEALFFDSFLEYTNWMSLLARSFLIWTWIRSTASIDDPDLQFCAIVSLHICASASLCFCGFAALCTWADASLWVCVFEGVSSIKSFMLYADPLRML